MPRSFRILIVEDNVDLRLDLRDFFDLAGYNVSIAADGREALDSLAHSSVELIISDYEMPNMDGYVLLQSLRAQEATSRMPFILISGGIPPTVDDDPKFRFLQKPVIIERLITTIEQLIAQKRTDDLYRASD